MGAPTPATLRRTSVENVPRVRDIWSELAARRTACSAFFRMPVPRSERLYNHSMTIPQSG